MHGELYKKSNSKAAHFFKVNEYLKRYYHVDFGKREFTQRKSYHPEAKVKRTPFCMLLEVSVNDENELEK